MAGADGRLEEWERFNLGLGAEFQLVGPVCEKEEEEVGEAEEVKKDGGKVSGVIGR